MCLGQGVKSLAIHPLLALSPDGSTIKAQPFYNIGGVFDSGYLVRKQIDGLNGILSNSIQLTDWDADGFFDVLVPFNSGDIIAFTLTPATLVIDEVPIKNGPLTQVSLEDFDQDTYEDILTLSSDINALTLVLPANLSLSRLKISVYFKSCCERRNGISMHIPKFVDLG